MSKTQEVGNHLEVFFYKVPKKNREALEKNLNKFRPWFQNNNIGLDYYRLGSAQTMEGCEGIAKTLSVGDDEDVWVELQYYRDRKHAEDAFAKMMQDKSIEPLGKEFFGLITQGKSMIAGGFDRLKQ
jgi:uncharacterized protein YbaA (DUF1428 family)